MTPTARSLKHLRDNGFTAEVVERYNSFTRRRHDLFNFADILGFRGNEVVLIQTTTRGHLRDRWDKVVDSPTAQAWVVGGNRIEVHGWVKRNRR